MSIPLSKEVFRTSVGQEVATLRRHLRRLHIDGAIEIRLDPRDFDRLLSSCNFDDVVTHNETKERAVSIAGVLIRANHSKDRFSLR